MRQSDMLPGYQPDPEDAPNTHGTTGSGDNGDGGDIEGGTTRADLGILFEEGDAKAPDDEHGPLSADETS